MKTSWLIASLLALALAATPMLSEAKRLGCGRSSGLQRNMPARTAPEALPAKPATPNQAAPAAPATAGAAAVPAAKRSWLGPIAGLAAGLGLAALMSHLGMGEAFGSVVLLALLALAGVFVLRLLMRRTATPQPAAGGNSGAARAAQVAWPAAAPTTPAAMAPVSPRAFVPADFDSEGFARIARTIFVRLQAANDRGDLDDLRRFTTPEMYAEFSLDLQDRGGVAQQTEVVQVAVELLDLADDGQRQIASVRFHGLLREESGAPPTGFDEVWHLVKPAAEAGAWVIAGIEQQPDRP